MTQRVPPHSLESELSVLGSMILDPDCIGPVRAILKEDDFYRLDNRLLFRAIIAVFEKTGSIDVVLVKEELKNTNNLAKVGGVEYLTRVMSSSPTSCNAEHYAREVRDCSVKRRLISLSQKVETKSYNGERPDEIVAAILGELPTLVPKPVDSRFDSCGMADGITALEAHLEKIRTGGLQVVPLPWPTLMAAFGGAGIPVGNIGLLVSLSGAGKTWMAYQMAIEATMGADPVPTYIVNTEMSARGYMSRIIALLSGDPLAATPGSSDYIEHVSKAAAEFAGVLQNMPVEITDSGDYDTKTVVELAERKAKDGYRLIILDHLGEIDTRGKREWEEFPIFVKQLREVARGNDAVIVVVSHLRKGQDGQIELAYCKRLRTVVDFMLLLQSVPMRDVEIEGPCGPELKTINRLLLVDKIRDAEDGYAVGFNFDYTCLQMKDCGKVRARHGG